MKLKNLAILSAAVVLSASASAQSYLYNNGGTYQGAVPVGIIVNDSLRDSLQTEQLGVDCAGESTAACMPSLSSIELASLITTNGSNLWSDYGLPAFPGGPAGFGNIVLTCGSPTIDDPNASAIGATKVAANEVGMGCSASLPYGKYNTITDAYSNQADMADCTNLVSAFAVNVLGFAARSETLPSGFSFTKFNGTAPELANLLTGEYLMFGDVHGDAITDRKSVV